MAKTRPRTGGTPNQRQLRVGEVIRRALAEILARGELHDEELAHVSITVSEVRVSPDLRHATAFVLPLGGVNTREVVKALGRNRAELRRLVTDRIDLQVLARARLRARHPLRPDGPHPRAAALRAGPPRPRRLRMSRRSRGRPVHGWLIVDKPAGPTSAAVVAKAKWASAPPRPGTPARSTPPPPASSRSPSARRRRPSPSSPTPARPIASPCAGGRRPPPTTPRARSSPPRRLGRRRTAIRAALPAFTGDILQVPPQVSAVKVEGARAYDLARAGATLDLAARPLHVERLELVATPDPDTAVLEMTCGKGGYVRSIARDLGAALGCLGHVAELRRLWSGPFTLEGAVTWPEIEARRRGARRPAAAARGGARRRARARLPAAGRRAAAQRQPGAAAGAGARGGRHRLGERRRRAARHRHLARRRAPSVARARPRLMPRRRRLPRAARARGAPRSPRSAPGPSSPSPTRWPRARPTPSTPASCSRCATPPTPPTRSAPAGSRS